MAERSDREQQTDEQPLAAYALGLLDDYERVDVERAISSDPTLRRRCAAWPTAIAAITCAALVIDRTAVEARLEQRLIQRARIERPPTVRSWPVLRAAQRGVVWVALVGLVAIAALFGYLAFLGDEPISGRAIALSEDGVTGVLVPEYEKRLFALIFWGLPELEANETWQLWLVRESGMIEAGPTFTRDEEGRAAISINPNLLESADALIGFAISRDDPSTRVDDAPSSDDILYQFPRQSR